jgi:hypothetical protein
VRKKCWPLLASIFGDCYSGPGIYVPARSFLEDEFESELDQTFW